MRKLSAMILIGIILTVSVSAAAEYKQYQLTEGEVGGNTSIIPLDAHNAVVIARSMRTNPWHVTWYRDGEKYRDISGSTKDPVRAGREIPYPAVWDGEQLTMLCNEARDAGSESSPDAGSFQTFPAKWTENGLERLEDLPEAWYSSYHCGETVLFREGNRWRIRYHGHETTLPDQINISPDAVVADCMPLSGESFLLSVYEEATDSRYLLGVDHEKEKYRIGISDQAYLQARDGQGGFFCTDDWPAGDCSPLALTHYDADGHKDRTFELGGSSVIVQLFGSAADPDTGLCTLYGSAVANSRKVYAVFAMTLDAGQHVSALDVRKIDPAYGDYNPSIYLAGDGTAWVFICDMKENRLRPVLIPFALLEKSKEDYNLTLR